MKYFLYQHKDSSGLVHCNSLNFHLRCKQDVTQTNTQN